LRKVLSSDATPLPSSSIFVNIGRVVVWVIGICVIMSSCFNVDVSGAITALGVGGIAISLGFQDTLSNLIGGLQLSLTKLVEPGDHIKVSGEEGIVHDVTWRHTTIITTRGEYVIIPNSVINSEALKKLPHRSPVRIDIIVTPKPGESLSQVTREIETAVDAAVGAIALLEQKTKIEYSAVTTQGGYKGLLSFAVGEGVKLAEVKDVALKAMGDCAHKTSTPHKPTSNRSRHTKIRTENTGEKSHADHPAKSKDSER
jgi:small-conductance mechanosensitive channel